MRRGPEGRRLLAAGPCSLFLVGQGTDIWAWGCPAPFRPSWHPLLRPLQAWGPRSSPLSHATPTPPHGPTQCSGTQSMPSGSRGQASPSSASGAASMRFSHPPQPRLLRPGSGDLLLSVPCSRPGWVFRWKEGCSGETEILALGSTSRGSRCTGVKREGQAGGRYLVPSSGLPSPSVFPSSSVFWSSVFSLCCFFRRTHFTTISTRITTAKKPPTEAPTMTATVESCFGGSGETGHRLRAHSPHLGQPGGATGNRQGSLPLPGSKPCTCNAG